LSDGVTQEGSRTRPVVVPGQACSRTGRQTRLSQRSDVTGSRLGEAGDPMLPRKASNDVSQRPVPETDTGGQVENTEAIGITVVKELGKLPP
jgi:hypothetical protein